MNKLDNAAGPGESGLLESETAHDSCQTLITQGHVPPQISGHLALEAAKNTDILGGDERRGIRHEHNIAPWHEVTMGKSNTSMPTFF
jgi:hypothetical protein